jgi:hypothetical protein
VCVCFVFQNINYPYILPWPLNCAFYYIFCAKIAYKNTKKGNIHIVAYLSMQTLKLKH